MPSKFADYVYDRAIDYIENRADDNDIRHDYAVYMSKGQWNNQEMGNLVDAIVVILDDQLRDVRSEREETNIIRTGIANIIDAHAGYIAMSDRRLVDSVDDNTYRSLKKAASTWEDIIATIRGDSRGRGRDVRQQSAGRRSVFDNSGGAGQRRGHQPQSQSGGGRLCEWPAQSGGNRPALRDTVA